MTGKYFVIGFKKYTQNQSFKSQQVFHLLPGKGLIRQIAGVF
jgi:hypothetical protein